MPDLERVLDDLKDTVALVEGKKDLNALKGLGIERVIAINSRPLIAVVQQLERQDMEVVVLTDFDKQGRKLNQALVPLLQRYRIKTNARLRHMMRAFGKTRIEDFAGLDGAAESPRFKKKGEKYGETRANVDKVHYQRKNQGQRRHREA